MTTRTEKQIQEETELGDQMIDEMLVSAGIQNNDLKKTVKDLAMINQQSRPNNPKKIVEAFQPQTDEPSDVEKIKILWNHYMNNQNVKTTKQFNKASLAAKKCNLLKALRTGQKTLEKVLAIYAKDSNLQQYWPNGANELKTAI